MMQYLPIPYKGVLVSLKPRKVPCAAKDKTIAGAPKALSEVNCSAGARIGESCKKNKARYVSIPS